VASAIALAVSLAAVPSCGPKQDTTITQPGQQRSSEDETGGITPLERGQLRTALLQDVRAAIDAWKASDPETMRDYFAEDVVDKFEKTWDGYATDGRRIEHVHKTEFLDVIDLNADATQALVTYRYDDDSYLVDIDSGAKAETLEAFDDKEMQLTIDRQDDGDWMIVRIIAAEDAFR
jgi:hypothetical protein